MKKSLALDLLGGTAASVARECRISPSAVSQWSEDLTKDQTDRVQAALWRKHSSGCENDIRSVQPQEASNA